MGMFDFSKKRAAWELRRKLEEGCNVDVNEIQRLADYLYPGYADGSKVFRMTSRGIPIDEPFRKMCQGLVRDLRCQQHDHKPYVLSEGTFLFIACCCAELERKVRVALSESFDDLV